MKRFCRVGVLPLLLMITILSCEKDQGLQCKLKLNFTSEYNFLALKKLNDNLHSKGVTEQIPDTNDFILSVENGKGGSIYYGTYRDKPQEFILDEGGYTVSVVSKEQTDPCFNSPQYGDSHVVFLQNGDNINLSFLCKHINSGVRINYSSDFARKFPDYFTTLKCGEYMIEYPYSETRVAYCIPSRVELLMRKGSKEDVLFSKDVAAGTVLTVNLTASTQSDEDGMDVVVDTTKLWLSEDITWGDEEENYENNALTVRQARDWIGAKEVWVKGYIVGGDLSTTKINFKTPFKTASNFAISDNRNETNRSNCMSVELTSGDVRNALNLVSHPTNLKKYVFVKGEIDEQYFGLVGVKKVKNFRIN